MSVRVVAVKAALVIALGVAVDAALAKDAITELGNECFICEDINQGATCNNNNADFSRTCNPSDCARCPTLELDDSFCEANTGGNCQTGLGAGGGGVS